MRRLVRSTLYVFLLGMVIVQQSARAAVIDLTYEGASGSANGALFYQFNEIPTGTGVIDSFLRIQGFGVQQGYNTDGTVEFETMSSFTHSIQISDVPTVDIGGTLYREFLLDINQDGERILSVDEIRIALWDTGNLSGYSSIFASPIFDLDAGGDNWIKVDDLINTGGGHGDMLALIPDSLFTGLESQYVYLYSKFGVNSVADNGFEEWAYGTQGPLIPEPATIALLGLGTLFVLRRKRR
ncbi:MAG: PEP-CTERM sorting domain-containing protein [Planctomycetota bacterium]|nr:MAG: PEP-CTERM sorting domain-containing protein [Planctomycetota bacterium]